MIKLFLSFLLIIPFSASAQAEEECIFDESEQTDEFLQSIPEFSDYAWNNETKIATITLETEEVLVVHRGGCSHFELSGTLTTNDTKDLNDRDYWFERALWIAKRIFNEVDYNNLKKSIENHTYSTSDDGSYYVSFPHDFYSEFAMTLKRMDGKVELYIGYYFS